MNDVLPRRARLITLEGGEGAGKSTALATVRDCLQAAGANLVVSREPGGTPLAEQLRAMVLHASRQDDADERLHPSAELLMVFAARAQHVAEVIEPALARGDWVLCDRFTDSSFAYQGAGRGLDMAWLADLERRVVGFLPGLTLWLDVPVAVGRARVQGRGGVPDAIEREQDDFFERVHGGFAARMAADPQRFARIDASLPLAQMVEQVQRAVTGYLQQVA